MKNLKFEKDSKDLILQESSRRISSRGVRGEVARSFFRVWVHGFSYLKRRLILLIVVAKPPDLAAQWTVDYSMIFLVAQVAHVLWRHLFILFWHQVTEGR